MWWMGSWVRSNGILYSGFLLLHGVGLALQPNLSSMRRWLTIFGSLILGMLMFLGSMGLHNYKAFRNHCVEETRYADCLRPDWCDRGATFNLYSYVQRKYWNVGLLRYYELKQIPNFLLAAPVLVLSITAVVHWIRHSWTVSRAVRLKQSAHRMLPTALLDIWQWTVISLRLFAGDDASMETTASSLQYYESWHQSPLLLGHYAILAASTLLCLTVAHVQIATRLICSSCPAFYWFLASRISQGGVQGEAILFWCLLFILLGVILHPSWLPWT